MQPDLVPAAARALPTAGRGLWSRLWNAAISLPPRKLPRQLQLCETVHLGEKRFVAVVRFEAQRFLIGGSAQSVSLLARLGESPDFASLMTEWCERQR